VKFTEAAKYYKALPHQQAAWNWLQDQVGVEQLNEFADMYRADPEPKPSLTLDPALRLVKEFEGCRLVAYDDGVGVWTIGWGSTTWKDGALVKKGDKITQEVADDLLLNTVANQIVPTLRKTIPDWDKLSANKQGALISFAYNLGWHFYGATGFETITKALHNHDYAAVPAALQLYVNPGTAVEVGLRRRREAEAKLWAGAAARINHVELKVAWENQNNNLSGTGYRECFSSSCAMVARFFGKVANDDAYNAIRARYGDTTDAQAQIQALRSIGLEARLVTNAAPGLLETELRAGRPIAVGWLHKGPISAPTGGGHWSVISGFESDKYWIVNDPNGEADLVNGGYLNNSNGAGLHYSYQNFNRRWMPDGASSGWALLVRPA
jgi:GH24 family phage-related lysozyme (muramidase)